MFIDARGKACPMPVVMAKKQLDLGCDELTVEVDNDTAVQNLKKLGGSMGKSCKVENDGKDFKVLFLQGEESVACDAACLKAPAGGYSVFIGKEFLGDGSQELGASLMKMAIYTLSESAEAPEFILFMNGGVKLVAGGEKQIADNVNAMIKKGTKALVCGTCLNYYGISEKLAAGEVSNMYDILSAMESSGKVISL